MRWIASLVAEAYRILMRGGVFLYPRDRRPGYARTGGLRLLYEANPIAFLVEQAGGAATDGVEPILDRVPASLHERTPFVFGSAREVARIERYLTTTRARGRDARRCSAGAACSGGLRRRSADVRGIPSSRSPARPAPAPPR